MMVSTSANPATSATSRPCIMNPAADPLAIPGGCGHGEDTKHDAGAGHDPSARDPRGQHLASEIEDGESDGWTQQDLKTAEIRLEEPNRCEPHYRQHARDGGGKQNELQ